MSENSKIAKKEKKARKRRQQALALEKEQRLFFKRHPQEDGLYRFMRKYKWKVSTARKRLAELGVTPTNAQMQYAVKKKADIAKHRRAHKEQRKRRLAIREEQGLWAEEGYQEPQEDESLNKEMKQRREVLEAMGLDKEDILTIEGKDWPY